jgi:ABC-type branched-subunit amino acid transport system ATPase component
VRSTKTKRLSRGQRRLLSLAECLAGDPLMLLVDEPLWGLADKEVSTAMAVFRELVNQNRTVVGSVCEVV